MAGIRIFVVIATTPLALAACVSEPQQLRIDDVTPASAPVNSSVAVRVAGRFGIRVHVSYVDSNRTTVDATYHADLGPYALTDVRRVDQSTLTATVPAILPPARYDLVVSGPDGRTSTLADAFEILTTSACADEPTCTCPGDTEVCDGVADEDCDGEIDEEDAEGCQSYFRDEDGDGFGVDGDSRCLCAPFDVHRALTAGDCDDDPTGCGAACHPGSVETCDGRDNDCDPSTSEPAGRTFLWLTTPGDSSAPSGAPGLDTWRHCDVLRFDGPGLALDTSPATGTFYVDLRLESDSASACASIAALERVEVDIVVGQSLPFQLLAGDLLISPDGNVTFSSLNTLPARDEDVVVFRPASLGDYSSGTFSMLLDSPLANSLEGITLVHEQTRVGDYDIPAGALLLAQGGNIQGNRIYLYIPDSAGASTSGAQQVLLDGDDIGLSANVRSLHLVETDLEFGGRQLRRGQLLLSVSSNDTIGAVDIGRQDLLVLDVTATSLQGSAAATAAILLPGVDVGLDLAEERPAGVDLLGDSCE